MGWRGKKKTVELKLNLNLDERSVEGIAIETLKKKYKDEWYESLTLISSDAGQYCLSKKADVIHANVEDARNTGVGVCFDAV